MGKQFAEAFFRQDPGPRHHPFLMFLPDHPHSVLRQVADDTLHITADITDFRKFCCFHFYEGSIDKLCETPCDLGLSDACRADHQDIFRNDLVTKAFFYPAAAIAVPERDGNSLFCFILANDKTIQLVNDLSWCQMMFIHALSTPAFFRRSRP